MSENLQYWLALKMVKGVGPATTKCLLERFKTPAKIFSAPLKALLQVRGLREESAREIVSFPWDNAEKEIEKASSLGISILSWEDEDYPANLLNIQDPPLVIYVAGELKQSDSFAIAMVGSRNSSGYGINTAESFSSQLAGAGITIVSGMARGIDTAAHQGAIIAGGRTIAVLGCGLNIVYPPENRNLFKKIRENGALVSEFLLGTPPDAINFPRRNRIISALSKGVIVVEASLKSGSLITAKYALEQNREVYAIPGNVNSMKSRGTNSLIKEGAKLVERPEEVIADILPQLGKLPQSGKQKPEPVMLNLTDKEENIFSQLTSEPLHIDELAKGCTMDMGEISSLLLSLELMGAARQHPGKMFTKRFIEE